MKRQGRASNSSGLGRIAPLPDSNPTRGRPLCNRKKMMGRNVNPGLTEPNEINAMIVIELLARRGAAVDRAENGQAVVERFRSMPAGTYDAILMDIQMPVLNGWEAAERIRGLNREDAGAIPIIALSANDYTEDVERSRAAGMNGHVGKPIDLNVLKAQLAAATAEAAYRGNE
jgi:CheY-like chemotaxis protein